MNHNSSTHPNIPLSEKFRSLPGFFGVQLEEQAPYDVLKTETGIEIRSYSLQTQARVTVRGDFKSAQKEAFNALAGYIFGANRKNEKMNMTTPVLVEEKNNNQEWTMSFILSPIFSITNLPKPDDKRISLHERPMHIIASISYPGISNEEKIAEYSTALKKWLKRRPWYVPVGEFQTAQFDGPLTIPFFRKNEIHIEIKHIH